MIKIGNTTINRIVYKKVGETDDISIVKKSAKDDTGTDLIFIGLNNYKTTFPDLINLINDNTWISSGEFITLRTVATDVPCSAVRFRVESIPDTKFACTFQCRLSFRLNWTGLGDDVLLNIHIVKSDSGSPAILCSSSKRGISRTLLTTVSHPCDIYFYINPTDFKLYITMQTTIPREDLPEGTTVITDTLLSPKDYKDIPLNSYDIEGLGDGIYPKCEVSLFRDQSVGTNFPIIEAQFGSRNMAVGEIPEPNYFFTNYDRTYDLYGESSEGVVPILLPES